LGGPVCDNRRLVRQDLLDQIVWAEVIRLLEDRTLIQRELDRRLAAARASDPTKKREQSLQRELIQVGKGIERLLTAYQEGLLSIEQLRQRMPALRNREQMLRSELQAIADQINDRAAFLRLAETLTAFLARLRSAAETLNVAERQRIVRLVVKEVLVGENDITIRHSIPIPSGSPPNGGAPSGDDPNYLLCKGSDQPTAGQSVSALRVRSVDAAKLVAPAVRAVRGRHHRPLQDGAGSELGACQNSGTVEAVWVGTASGEDESGLLQGCQSATDSPEREVRLSGVHVSASDRVWSEGEDLL
jgi:site-specific DNA recombinase